MMQKTRKTVYFYIAAIVALEVRLEVIEGNILEISEEEDRIKVQYGKKSLSNRIK